MPKGPQGQKRPVDGVGCANLVAKIATGEAEDNVVDKVRGVAGGKARAEKLSSKARSEIAKKAAQSRWGKTSRMEQIMTQTAKKETGSVASREAVRMYPNNSLREPVRDYHNTFADVVKKTFTK